MRTRGHDSPIAPVATLAVLLCCGVLLPATVAAQVETPPRRVKIVRSDTTVVRSDSTMVRVTINTDRIEQAIHELMASKAMEQTIGLSLRAAASGQAGDPKKIRELSEELARIAQKNAALITTIEMGCAGDRQPEGYFGLQFSELQTVLGGDAPQAPPLREYPRIDSVYPGSPASKAGLRRGDVVLLLGGQDARRPVALDKLLRPLAKVPVRVQREGAQKDYTVVVEKRPTDFNSECANVDQVIGPEFDQPMIYMRSRLGQRTPFPLPVFPRSQTPTAAPDAPTSPVPPMPPVAGFMYGFSTSNSAIAGATLMPLDDDWRATLGVDNGVLVTKVLPGTPSKDSGLHAGDVIISADGQTVASVRSLSRIVGNAKANSVKLQIIRSGKPQVITLRWQEASPDE
jgi:S1-C subfamily serine protease